MGGETVTLLRWEGVTQGDPLSIVIYRITPVPLLEDPWAGNPGLLTPFFADDVAFDGSAQRSAQLLNLPTDRGPDWVYFPKLDKLMFIADTLGEEEEVRREFTEEGIELNFVDCIWYLGPYLGTQ